MNEFLQASEATRLALHGMALLAAADGEARTARTLARALKASAAHLAKVLQGLERAGLVSGTRGPAGGYRLSRPADRIRLSEVYGAVAGALPGKRCAFDVPVCGGSACPLSGFFAGVNRQVADKLRETRLSEVSVKGRS
jgi:Rrf2 family protein